jgi:hypothetical protein
MPTFTTPEPISVTIDIARGDVKITASDRADTVVEVSPSDRTNDSDIKAAEHVHVDYAGGKLLVKELNQPWHQLYRSFRRGGSIDVTIELPAGSHLQGSAAWAAFRCAGRLGECELKCDYGDIRLDETGSLKLKTTYGEIIVDRAVGDVELANAAGDVQIGAIDGKAVLENDRGASKIGQITGNLRITGMSGGIIVDQAHASVEAKTAHGNIRLVEVVRGEIRLTTSSGIIEIGVRTGTAAKLDVSSMSGRVRCSLDPVDGPAQFDETVELRARTQYGDISIHRSQLSHRRVTGRPYRTKVGEDEAMASLIEEIVR